VTNRRLCVFVKAPRAGFVKTRLAAGLGDAAALAAYRRLLDVTLDRVRELAEVELRFTPDDAAGELGQWLRPGWTAAPQGGGDLGERLLRAVAEAHAQGIERLVIIGSDCPHVTAADIRLAWARLEEQDVVLGPARDGGYWLIALRAVRPELFRDIPWSSGEVLRQTLRRAQETGLTVSLLHELGDVDTVEDWAEFLRLEALREGGLSSPVRAASAS